MDDNSPLYKKTLSLNISKTLSSQSTASASVTYDDFESFEIYSVGTNRYRITFRSLLTYYKWSASASLSFVDNEDSDDEDNIEKNNRSIFSSGLTYGFRPWAGLTLGYFYADYTDEIVPGNNYYNNIITFTLRFSKTKRL